MDVQLSTDNKEEPGYLISLSGLSWVSQTTKEQSYFGARLLSRGLLDDVRGGTRSNLRQMNDCKGREVRSSEKGIALAWKGSVCPRAAAVVSSEGLGEGERLVLAGGLRRGEEEHTARRKVLVCGPGRGLSRARKRDGGSC